MTKTPTQTPSRAAQIRALRERRAELWDRPSKAVVAASRELTEATKRAAKAAHTAAEAAGKATSEKAKERVQRRKAKKKTVKKKQR